MTVQLSQTGTITLTGDCTSDEAELLLQLLSVSPTPLVDWRACTSAHTAIIQILMAAKPDLLGPPAGGFLQIQVEPRLMRASS